MAEAVFIKCDKGREYKLAEAVVKRVLTSFHKQRFVDVKSRVIGAVFIQVDGSRVNFKSEVYLLETTFILWIKSSSCVPTILRSV